MLQSTVSSSRRGPRPGDWDPTSPKITGAPHLYAPAPRSVPSLGGLQEREDDADSNVQDGLRSELGEMQVSTFKPNGALGRVRVVWRRMLRGLWG